MKTIRVTYDNGDTITTGIKGGLMDIQKATEQQIVMAAVQLPRSKRSDVAAIRRVLAAAPTCNHSCVKLGSGRRVAITHNPSCFNTTSRAFCACHD